MVRIECPHCDSMFTDGENAAGSSISPRNNLWSAESRFWIHCITKHRDRITVYVTTPNDLGWYTDE